MTDIKQEKKQDRYFSHRKMDGNDDGGHDMGNPGGKKRPNESGDYSGSPQKKGSFMNGEKIKKMLENL